MDDEHKAAKERAFDSYCRKVMRNEARNIYRDWDRLHRYEIPISALTYDQLSELFTSDDYFAGERIFQVYGFQVIVDDEDLAGAIERLTDRRRDIILSSYFLELSDREIGEKLDMLRATVQYQRQQALADLRRILMEEFL